MVENGGPALLFENVVGSPAPVVTFLFGSLKRINMVLGTADEKETIQRYLNALGKRWPEPEIVKDGPCKEEIIVDPDLTKHVPNITWGELDGGPYITLPLVITKDRDTLQRNVGIYRFMIHGPQEGRMLLSPTQHGGMMLKKSERNNEPLEMAIALGGDPVLYIAAVSSLGYGEDEFALAGAIRGEPLKLVKCETIDLEVPATAECVIEGEILPNVRRPEGPFGEYTGYYGKRGDRAVFRVKCITRRKDYVFPGAYMTKPFPPNEDTILRSVPVDGGILTQARKIIPEIRNFHMFRSSGSSYGGVVQIDEKPYQNYAKQVMDAIWATHTGCWIKVLIVVDKDIDIYELNDVMWAICTRVQPYEDTVVVNHHIGAPLDPSAARPGDSSLIGIDVPIKVPERFVEYPPFSIPSESLMRKVKEKFGREDFWGKLFKPKS